MPSPIYKPSLQGDFEETGRFLKASTLVAAGLSSGRDVLIRDTVPQDI